MDSEELAYFVAAFGNKEGAGVVQELNGLHLVFLIHQRHRLAYDLYTLLHQLIQQIGDIAGDGLGLLLLPLSGGELLERSLHGQHQGDIVVDAEDPDGGAVVIPDVDGGGLEDLAVLGAG